ncbi:hypothetical protein ACOTVQ_02215 [Aliarcobacter butzleri]
MKILSNEKKTNCFDGFGKLIILFLIPILVGYIIFEVEKIDTIRTKKMESFEIIIDSFNKISNISYNKDLSSVMDIIYNTFLLNEDVLLKQKQFDEIANYLYKDILELKFQKLKFDRIVYIKGIETEVDTLITRIKYHENLLKGYYGYSMDDSILSISKMLAVIKSDKIIKEKLNEELLNILEKDIKPLIFKTVDVKSIEEAKDIIKNLQQRISDWEYKNIEISKKIVELRDLYQKESDKLYENIYFTYLEELNTSIFKLYTDKNKDKFSKIVNSSQDNIIKLQISKSDTGELYFEELKDAKEK